MEEKQEREVDLDNIDRTIKAIKLPAWIEYNQRWIIFGSLLILILLIVFLGFIYGAARVCDQVDGIMDNGFYCHTKPMETYDPYAINPEYMPIKNAE